MRRAALGLGRDELFRLRLAERSIAADAEIQFSNGDVYLISGVLGRQVGFSIIEDNHRDTEAWMARSRELLTGLVRERAPRAKLPPLEPYEVIWLAAYLVGEDFVEVLRKALERSAP